MHDHKIRENFENKKQKTKNKNKNKLTINSLVFFGVYNGHVESDPVV